MGQQRAGVADSGVAVLRSPEEVLTAARAWDSVPSLTGLVGGSAWVTAWLEVYGPGHALAVGVAGGARHPSAVLPLVRSRRRPWVWEMLGVRPLYEPTDLRGDDPAAVTALVAEVARRRLPLRLRRLPADSSLLAHLEPFGQRGAAVRTLSVLGTPTISLDERWVEPEHHFSSRRRGDLRTARRRAEAAGEVALSIEAPAPEAVPALLDEIVAVEASGWKTGAGTALALQPRMRAFYLCFCTLAAEQKALRVAALRIDGRPAAVQLAVEDGGRYSLHKIAFDQAFARCSPGNLLMLHAVRQAAEKGLRSFEFLGAEEPWTALWTDEVRACVDLHVYPRSLGTPFAAGENLARRAGRRVLSRSARRGKATAAATS